MAPSTDSRGKKMTFVIIFFAIVLLAEVACRTDAARNAKRVRSTVETYSAYKDWRFRNDYNQS